MLSTLKELMQVITPQRDIKQGKGMNSRTNMSLNCVRAMERRVILFKPRFLTPGLHANEQNEDTATEADVSSCHQMYERISKREIKKEIL